MTCHAVTEQDRTDEAQEPAEGWARAKLDRGAVPAGQSEAAGPDRGGALEQDDDERGKQHPDLCSR